MYKLRYTTKSKKDLKKLKKDPVKIKSVIETVAIITAKGHAGVPPEKKPHKLTGQYKNNWECHARPDICIIWVQNDKDKVITLVRIGSHSELF